MNRWIIALLVWIEMVPFSGHAYGETLESGIQWLLNMQTASSELSYQGVVTYIKGQQVESFKIFHNAGDEGETERLISMNSPLREVIRSAGTVVSYRGDSSRVVVETGPSSASLLVNLPNELGEIDRYYKVGLRGQEYVTGHLAQVVALEPQDRYRYTRLFWIDTGSKLPLKMETLNESGDSVEQIMFSSLSVLPQIDRENLEPAHKGTKSISRIKHREPLPLGSLEWSLEDVPDGFHILSYDRMNRPPHDQPIEHILLGDGFSNISVYIEKGTPPPMKSPANGGAINIETVKRGEYSVTVMGEAPARAILKIAHGVTLKR